MKYLMFIGDIIASQISLELETKVKGDFWKKSKYETDRIISMTSHDMPPLTTRRINLYKYNRVYYSIGYSDLISLDRRFFHGFQDRVETDIKQLLNHEKPITLIIPLLCPSNNEDIDKEYLKIYQDITGTLDYIVDQYNISYIDLREIIEEYHINFKHGLNQEGLDLIIDYFYKYELS